MSYRLNDPSGERDTVVALNNISVRTMWENRVKPVIAADLSARLGGDVIIEDNGIDNTGGAILDDTLVRADPDWKIILPGGKTIISEILVHPEYHQSISFKVEKLQKVSPKTCIFVVQDSGYYVVKYAHAQYLLENEEVKNVQKVYGGKDSIILNKLSMKSYIKYNKINYNKYTQEAQDVIAPMLTDQFWGRNNG
jgi:hypothetical protein